MKKSLIYGLFFLLLLVSACGQKKTEDIDKVASESATSEETEISVCTESDTMVSASIVPELIHSLLEVHYIDVGQGDSTLIVCDGEAMLIDGGNVNKGTTVQLYLKKQNVSSLKYMIATHPDADHIGGLDVIVTKFDIANQTVWMPDIANDTPAYQELLDAIDYRKYKTKSPDIGESFKLGAADVTILGPKEKYSAINDNSIIVKVSLGETSFLFMGDAGEMAERDIESEAIADTDVLKAGHHGSKSSTSKEFTDIVKPMYAVISCGAGNDYGHPSDECLEILKNAGVTVLRTDELGSIVAYSDGTDITWNFDPTEAVANKEPEATSEITYVVNTNSNIFHKPDCDSVGKMKEKNRTDVTFTLEELIEMGIKPCGACKPDK